MNNHNSDAIAYYDRKTELILQKYGPGPRVHFHGGLIEPDTESASSIDGLRQQLIQSQEDVLYEAGHVWNAEKHLSGTVLDVGCGLGGDSLFWAQEYGAQVLALTNVPRHVELVAQFATQARVADQVIPILGDAHAVPGDQIFDAAVSINSSCYFDRERWFQHLSSRLRPDGRVFILDIFLGSEDGRELMDRYYRTRIGGVDEYEEAAAAAGFSLDNLLDITTRSVRYWDFTVLHSRRLIESGTITDEKEVQRLQRSIEFHTWLGQQYINRGIIYALLSFVHSQTTKNDPSLIL